MVNNVLLLTRGRALQNAMQTEGASVIAAADAVATGPASDHGQQLKVQAAHAAAKARQHTAPGWANGESASCDEATHTVQSTTQREPTMFIKPKPVTAGVAPPRLMRAYLLFLFMCVLVADCHCNQLQCKHHLAASEIHVACIPAEPTCICRVPEGGKDSTWHRSAGCTIIRMCTRPRAQHLPHGCCWAPLLLFPRIPANRTHCTADGNCSSHGCLQHLSALCATRPFKFKPRSTNTFHSKNSNFEFKLTAQ